MVRDLGIKLDFFTIYILKHTFLLRLGNCEKDCYMELNMEIKRHI